MVLVDTEALRDIYHTLYSWFAVGSRGVAVHDDLTDDIERMAAAAGRRGERPALPSRSQSRASGGSRRSGGSQYSRQSSRMRPPGDPAGSHAGDVRRRDDAEGSGESDAQRRRMD